jgi:hypothetical protein
LFWAFVVCVFWGGLQEAVDAGNPSEECRKRLDELIVELQQGEREAGDLANELEATYAELEEAADEAALLETRLSQTAARQTSAKPEPGAGEGAGRQSAEAKSEAATPLVIAKTKTQKAEQSR